MATHEMTSVIADAMCICTIAGGGGDIAFAVNMISTLLRMHDRTHTYESTDTHKHALAQTAETPDDALLTTERRADGVTDAAHLSTPCWPPAPCVALALVTQSGVDPAHTLRTLVGALTHTHTHAHTHAPAYTPMRADAHAPCRAHTGAQLCVRLCVRDGSRARPLEAGWRCVALPPASRTDTGGDAPTPTCVHPHEEAASSGGLIPAVSVRHPVIVQGPLVLFESVSQALADTQVALLHTSRCNYPTLLCLREYGHGRFCASPQVSMLASADAAGEMTDAERYEAILAGKGLLQRILAAARRQADAAAATSVPAPHAMPATAIGAAPTSAPAAPLTAASHAALTCHAGGPACQLRLDASTGLADDEIGVFSAVEMPDPNQFYFRLASCGASEVDDRRIPHVLAYFRTAVHGACLARVALSVVCTRQANGEHVSSIAVICNTTQSSMLAKFREELNRSATVTEVDSPASLDFDHFGDRARTPLTACLDVHVGGAHTQLLLVNLEELCLSMVEFRGVLAAADAAIVTGDASLTEAISASIPFWYSAEPHKRDIAASVQHLARSLPRQQSMLATPCERICSTSHAQSILAWWDFVTTGKRLSDAPSAPLLPHACAWHALRWATPKLEIALEVAWEGVYTQQNSST